MFDMTTVAASSSTPRFFKNASLSCYAANMRYRHRVNYEHWATREQRRSLWLQRWRGNSTRTLTAVHSEPLLIVFSWRVYSCDWEHGIRVSAAKPTVRRLLEMIKTHREKSSYRPDWGSSCTVARFHLTLVEKNMSLLQRWCWLLSIAVSVACSVKFWDQSSQLFIVYARYRIAVWAGPRVWSLSQMCIVHL